MDPDAVDYVYQGCVARVVSGHVPEEYCLENHGIELADCLFEYYGYDGIEPVNSYSNENAVRGVYGILDSLQIYGGDGTEGNPYHLK